MWHGWEKPLISSFSQKCSGPCVRKNFTWEWRKNLTKFRRSTTWRGGKPSKFFRLDRALSRFDPRSKLESLRKTRRGHRRSAKASVIAQWRESSDFKWSIETNLRQVFPHLFANLKWSFFSRTDPRIFKKNLKMKVFLARVTSSVYCSMSGVFSQSRDTEFLRKTCNQGFSSPVSHLVFIVLWARRYLSKLKGRCGCA